MNIGILIFSFQTLEYWNSDLFRLSILIITSSLGKNLSRDAGIYAMLQQLAGG